MKTHPITDHVPESELLAITPEGAARWLARHGWVDCNAVVFRGDARRVAAMVSEVAASSGRGPRDIIAEMQADSRIVAECARIAGKQEKP